MHMPVKRHAQLETAVEVERPPEMLSQNGFASIAPIAGPPIG